MKRRGRHPQKALSAVKVRSIAEPGRYADGDGLYLVVDSSGAKRWMLRTVVQGRRRDIGLGGLSTVSLAEARDEAAAMRKVARAGGDPIAARIAERRVVPTFAEAAQRVHAEQAPSWRNAKHGAQWLTTLETYVFPVIGDQRVDDVTTADILQILSPIWLEKAETARRVRQRIATVMDWAQAAGYRSGENPVNGVAKGLPKQKRKDAHHAAMPFDDVPSFISRLRASGAGLSVRLGFEFLILTATRTSEVLLARPEEIDLDAAVWAIPADRMKAEREHRVPLAPRALAIAQEAIEAFPRSPVLFPGQRPDRPLSNMAFLTTLRRMKVKATAHGFRSAFRDWAAERTSFPPDVCEMALAHAVRDKTEAAYRRGDLFEKRRALMAAWDRFVTCSSGDVVALPIASGN